MSKISVIVPVYNAREYISRCINSLLTQTYTNLEILIVNDGSTDNTADIIKEYLSKVTLIEQSNQGVSSARNHALKYARGDYILFLDSDDYLDPDCIEKLIYHAEKTNADIIKFRFCYEYNDGRRILEEPEFENGFYIKSPDFKEYIYKKFLTGISFNSVIRSMFKRELITSLRFRENMKTAEDAVFSLQAYTKAHSFLYISDIFYHYTQNAAGLTGRGLSVAEKYKYNLMLIRELLYHLSLWGMDSFKYKTLAIFRLFTITFSKLYRTLKK